MSDPNRMLEGVDDELLRELLEPLLLAHETGFNKSAGAALEQRLRALDYPTLLRIAHSALAVASAQTLRVDRLEEELTRRGG